MISTNGIAYIKTQCFVVYYFTHDIKFKTSQPFSPNFSVIFPATFGDNLCPPKTNSRACKVDVEHRTNKNCCFADINVLL